MLTLSYFCCFSVTKSCPTLCNPMDCSMPGFHALHYILKFAHTHVSESVMPSNCLILCHPLSVLPSIFPRIRVFSNELAFCISRPQYLSFSISPSIEYSGLISFRMDGFDFLAVQSAHYSDTLGVSVCVCVCVCVCLSVCLSVQIIQEFILFYFPKRLHLF